MQSKPQSRRLFLRNGTSAILSMLPFACGFSPMLSALESRRYGIEGRRAPPLDVQYWIDADGNVVVPESDLLKGKWVYLKCFQSWCPGCHEYGFPALKQVADTFADDPRVEVLAIQTVFEGFGTNTQDRLREMQLRYQLPIMMGHDPGDPEGDTHPRTMRDYRTGGTPWVVIVDSGGRVVFNNFHIDPEKSIDYIQRRLT